MHHKDKLLLIKYICDKYHFYNTSNHSIIEDHSLINFLEKGHVKVKCYTHLLMYWWHIVPVFSIFHCSSLFSFHSKKKTKTKKEKHFEIKSQLCSSKVCSTNKITIFLHLGKYHTWASIYSKLTKLSAFSPPALSV